VKYVFYFFQINFCNNTPVLFSCFLDIKFMIIIKLIFKISNLWIYFQFLKMQGKKHRGKEDINIVDVKADDFISSVELTKGMTEEKELRSHRKKDGPTSQQKRKHQITYLAFQVISSCLIIRH